MAFMPLTVLTAAILTSWGGPCAGTAKKLGGPLSERSWQINAKSGACWNRVVGCRAYWTKCPR